MVSSLLITALSLSVLSSAVALHENIMHFTPEIVADLASFSNATASAAQFHVYDDAFLPILGDNPTLTLILNSSNSSFPQFHEAAIVASTSPPVLFVTSNQYNFTGIFFPNTSNKTVAISRISFEDSTQLWTSEIISTSGSPIYLANGGTFSHASALIICAQGDLLNPGGLVSVSPSPPYTTTNLINNYLGTPFNSPNDVFQTSDGALWFTDPQFGSIQSIRPAPELPPQVYRWMPGTSDIRVVADSLSAPNGIGFSPDEKTAYVTDTAKSLTSPTATKTIYAYDVVRDGRGPVLANRRTFAMPGTGIPDGIKTDSAGNVYAGCGDGVNVWNAEEKLLGKIVVDGGSSNFAIMEGKVFLLNENKLWLAEMSGLKVSGCEEGRNVTKSAVVGIDGC